MCSLMYKISDDDFKKLVQESHSINEVCEQLGYHNTNGNTNKLFKKRTEELQIDYSHFCGRGRVKRTKENVFCKNSNVNQTSLRKWYKKENIQYICSICGISEWNNQVLTLRLDHINGDNHDNRLENLRWVCPNCDSQLNTYCGRNRYKNKKVAYCVDCGKILSDNRAKRCKDCYNLSNRISERPDRKTLKQLIRKDPFTQIGKQYGVSDNAVKKWCDYYNLPRLKKDIKSYSDEEWKKI